MKGPIAFLLSMLFAFTAVGAQAQELIPVRATGYVRPPKEVRDKVYAEAFAKHGHKLKAMAQVAKTSAPAEFDCRTAGWVQDWAGDQGSCGSCYLYATVKQFLDACTKAGQVKLGQAEMAIQFGMDRPRNFGGCGGGWGWEVASWMLKNGWVSEYYVDSSGTKITDYVPYEARSGNDRTRPGAKIWKVEDIGFVNGDQNGDQQPTLDEFKAAMLAYGSINFALAAGGQFSNYSGSGIITSLGSGIDHEIRAIGYSDSKQAVLVYNQWRGWGISGKGAGWISYQAFFRSTVDHFWIKVVGSGPVPPDPPIPPGPGPTPIVLGNLSLSVDVKAGSQIWLVPAGSEINPVGTLAKMKAYEDHIRELAKMLDLKAQNGETKEPPMIEPEKKPEPKEEKKQDARDTIFQIDMTFAEWQSEAKRASMPLVVGIGCDPPLGKWLSFRAEPPWGDFNRTCIVGFWNENGVLWRTPILTADVDATALSRKLWPEKKWNPYANPRDPRTGAVVKKAA